MSQSQRPPGGGGSVRRARELLELERGRTESASSTPSPPRPTRPAGNATPRPRQPMPPALSASIADGGQIGVAISRPTPAQAPQWPLGLPTQSNSSQSPSNRGPAPQRPPRPSHVPSMLDSSRIQSHVPTFQYTPQHGGLRHPEDDPEYTGNVTPLSPRSRPTVPAAAIPDFPLPTDQSVPVRKTVKTGTLGPPPSSRRGASSYYSNLGLVSPIAEETPSLRNSHKSYASSSAMPPNWKDDTSDFDTEDELHGPKITVEDDSRQSTADSDQGLVRNASIGRRGKPSMVNTKSADNAAHKPITSPVINDKLERMGVFGPLETKAAEMKAMAAAHARAANSRPDPRPIQRDTQWPMAGEGLLAGGTGFIDSSSDEKSIPQVTTPFYEHIGEMPVDSRKPVDPRISQILQAHKRASLVHEGNAEDGNGIERTYSPLSAIRRPPKLDINKVRDAEQRGSLTSLPDLIIRATKLAALIDKGKRPGSRLNMLNDFDDVDSALEKEAGGEYIPFC